MRETVWSLKYFRVGPFNQLRRFSFLLLLLWKKVVALWLNQLHDVLVQINLALIIHFKKLCINFQEICPVLNTLFGFFLYRSLIGLIRVEDFAQLSNLLLFLLFLVWMMAIVAVIYIWCLRYRVLYRLINLREVSGLKLSVKLIHDIFEDVLEEFRAEVIEALSDFNHEVREICLEGILHHHTQSVYLVYNIRQMPDLLEAF